MLDPITTEILKIGVGEATKIIFHKVLSSDWLPSLIKGKGIVEQLLSTEVNSDYVVKHVSRAMKIRTIHSSEKDVVLSDIYHPLIITNDKNDYKVDDDFLIDDQNITNIIGFAGQGKSTILRKILLESIKNGSKIPFFLELRKIEHSGIEDAILKILAELGVNADKIALRSLLASGHIKLLLDGFDEVSSANRESILHEIVELNRVFGLQIIATSRYGTEICNEAGIENLKVAKIKRTDIISIIKKLSASNEVEEDTLPQIFNLLKNNHTLVGALNSPLLVNLFYICYPHLDSIPNSGVEFYSKLFTTLYFRHDKIKNFRRERRASVNPSEAFNSFCALCFKSLYDNKLEFTYHSLVEYTKQSLMIIGQDDCSAEDMAADFIDITCLLQKDGYDRYVFLHKSIQEYHAAEYIKSLNLSKKTTFMTAILDSIKVEPKLLPTTRYLYEIDRENTFNLICLPLCKEVHLDTYDSRKDEFINDLYHQITDPIRIDLSSKIDFSVISGNEVNSTDFFGKYISAIGPFSDPLNRAVIFTRYFTGESSDALTSVLTKHTISDKVLKSILNTSYTIHAPDEESYKKDVGFIYLKDTEEFAALETEIKREMTQVVDNIYQDIYSENIQLIEKKDLAIKDLFGF